MEFLHKNIYFKGLLYWKMYILWDKIKDVHFKRYTERCIFWKINSKMYISLNFLLKNVYFKGYYSEKCVFLRINTKIFISRDIIQQDLYSLNIIRTYAHFRWYYMSRCIFCRILYTNKHILDVSGDIIQRSLYFNGLIHKAAYFMGHYTQRHILGEIPQWPQYSIGHYVPIYIFT